MRQNLSFVFVSVCPFMLGAYVPIILITCGVSGPLAFLDYLGHSIVWYMVYLITEGES